MPAWKRDARPKSEPLIDAVDAAQVGIIQRAALALISQDTFGPRFGMVYASSVAACSQLLGLTQIVLLLHGVKAARGSNGYFYLISWGGLPTQILLVGVLYPMLLRNSALYSRRLVNRIIYAAVALGIVLPIAAAEILQGLRRAFPFIWWVAICVGVTYGIGSFGWARALELAARGRPIWLSGVTLVNSLCACVALLASQGMDLNHRVLIAVAAMSVGSGIYLGVISWANGVRFVPVGSQGDIAPDSGSAVAKGAGWFLAQSISGFGAGMCLQTVAATLPRGGLSIVSIVNKGVGGFSTIATNTILPRLIHHQSEGDSNSRRYVGFVAVACGFLGAIDLLASKYVWSSAQLRHWFGLIAIGLAWCVAATLSAAIQRSVLRFQRPSATRWTIVSSLSIPIITLIAGTAYRPTVTVILAWFVLLDLVPGVIYSVLAGHWRLCTACVGTAALLFCGGAATL